MQNHEPSIAQQHAGDLIPFPDERIHLRETLGKLADALADAEANVQRIDTEYMETKLYMIQNRGEIDPRELFQSELYLRQVDSSGAFAASVRAKVAKLQESPYFARVDFLQGNDTITCYIGRYSFSHENELLIVDWRAPIASMFYDCEIGPAGYHAPSGRIEGILTLKRQFKIKNGELEYALETSDNVRDEVLQRELAGTSDERMKSMIATIQKEQNQIVRDEAPGTMIIQGVAGSGKTSIALHRIAFLLYRFKGRLSARNVAILSPSRVLSSYISNVLPELGEEPIYEIGLTDIAEAQLEGIIGFAPGSGGQETDGAQWAKRAQYKSTLAFVKLMDDFIAQLPETAISATAYSFDSFFVSAEWIRQRIDAYGAYPLLLRLRMIADDIHNRFVTDNIMGHAIPRPASILKSLKGMLRFKNTLALYRRFYAQSGHASMLAMPDTHTLEWEDAFPFLYLHAALYGLKESLLTKHLVIDEMQDYAPIQYAVINLLFRCPKTILGDFGQSINCNHQHNLEDLMLLYSGAKLVRLNTSYRSTYEITHFANQIREVEGLEAVARHGPTPQVTRCSSKQAELEEIRSLIRGFETSGYNTLCIIAKTGAEAQALFDALAGHKSVHLITMSSRSFEAGVSITCVQLSKGLEFDEVLIPGVDSGAYTAEHDRALLYVACTRAMHRLHVLYVGEISPLLAATVR